MGRKKIGALEIMVEEEASENEEFRFQAVGEQLKAERERQDLSLSDVAAKTRIPMRHLDAIEGSNFTALPGATYTLGFARNYARALGLDATKLAADLRVELEQSGQVAYQVPTQSYEPADVARIPPRALAWTAAAVAVLLVVAYLFWRSFALGDPGNPGAPVAVAGKTTTKAAPAAAAVDLKGQVTLTATDTVWLRVYDADGKRLYEAEMKAGDKYDVPADANGPMINIGKPEAVTVTIGGKPVPMLGKPGYGIKDVGISAAALLARPPEGATDAAATPTTGAVQSAAPASAPARQRTTRAAPASATAKAPDAGTPPAAPPSDAPPTGNPAN